MKSIFLHFCRTQELTQRAVRKEGGGVKGKKERNEEVKDEGGRGGPTVGN